MICRHCNAAFDEPSAYIAHLESLQDATQGNESPEAQQVDGIADVLFRNTRNANTRATPNDFNIL
jgi:hypothetical protein